ncbi:MAG: HAMP domain-containing histidine kinase [Chloroflexi bacterium]|nr:HAMP domain-containing histidine kinase [Chloroflexota bacterium]
MIKSLRGRLALSHLAVAMVGVVTVTLAVIFLGNRAADAYVSELDAQIARFEEERGFLPPGLARQQQAQTAQGVATDEFRGELVAAALIGTGVAATIAVALAVYVGGLVNRPVRRSAEAAGRFAAGERQLDLPTSGIRELDELRTALEQLGADLEAAERERDRVVDDVTHELRTPLAVLRGYVEGIRDQVIEPNAVTVERLLGELHRLELLVEDLRASTELSADDLVRKPVDLCHLLDEAAERHRLAATAAGVEITVDETPRTSAMGDEGRVAQVLDNLIGNAIGHAPRESAVRLSVEAKAGVARVEVRDDGPGLPAADHALVFQRLYRADTARARTNGGAGIGLAVARRIIEAHGGQIGVTSAPMQGAAFWFTLPLTKV